jgi:hypothetical protein
MQEQLEADHITTCPKSHDSNKVDDKYKHMYKQERNHEQEHDLLASDASTCSDHDGELEHVLIRIGIGSIV